MKALKSLNTPFKRISFLVMLAGVVTLAGSFLYAINHPRYMSEQDKQNFFSETVPAAMRLTFPAFSREEGLPSRSTYQFSVEFDIIANLKNDDNPLDFAFAQSHGQMEAVRRQVRQNKKDRWILVQFKFEQKLDNLFARTFFLPGFFMMMAGFLGSYGQRTSLAVGHFARKVFSAFVRLTIGRIMTWIKTGSSRSSDGTFSKSPDSDGA